MPQFKKVHIMLKIARKHQALVMGIAMVIAGFTIGYLFSPSNLAGDIHLDSRVDSEHSAPLATALAPEVQVDSQDELKEEAEDDIQAPPN